MKDKFNLSIEKSLKTVASYTRWIAIVVVAGILLSGVTFVQSGEVAVIFRFGKLVGRTPGEQVLQPGIHFALPYIFDRVVRIPVQKVQEVKIDGLYTRGSIKDITKTGYALTGDENVILLNGALKYKISDPLQYTLAVEEPEKILQELVTGVLMQEIASMQVDDVLTRQKKELADSALASAQKRADQIGLGVQMIALEFSNLQPPNEVKSEFDLVTSTNVQKETMIQQANSYREKVIPEAMAERDSMIQKARSYQAERIALAKSDVAQFYGVIEEYAKNPAIVKDRLYREKVEAIMGKVANTVIIPKGESGQNIILP